MVTFSYVCNILCVSPDYSLTSSLIPPMSQVNPPSALGLFFVVVLHIREKPGVCFF